MDEVEELARERAKELFGAEDVNVQPHSGAQANRAVPVSYTHLDVYKRQAIDAVAQLSVDVGIPTKLEAIKEDDLDFLAESALSLIHIYQQKGCGTLAICKGVYRSIEGALYVMLQLSLIHI